MAKEEKKTLETVLKELEKEYGVGSVIHGFKPEKIEVISTGSYSVDTATGINGIPRGKIIEVYGWESCGKTSLCQQIVGNAQKKGIKCIYVDGEGSIDEKYAKALGMNLEDLYIVQLDESAGEGAFNKVDKLVETGEFGLVVYDSYNSLQPKSVIEGEVGDSAIGKHARMLGQAVVKANALATKYNCTFIFIGQLREKIGMMFGNPQTTQGGNALKFYSHMRMEITRSVTNANSTIVDGIKTGNKVSVKIVKNKMAPPFATAETNIYYGIGFDPIQEIIESASDKEVLKIRAGNVTYQDTKYTLEEFKQLLIDNEEFINELKSKL